MPGVILTSPVRVVTALGERLRGRLAESALVFDSQPWGDRGAVVSIREIGAVKPENYFQRSDAFRFLKLVERRLLADLKEYLVDAGVDVSELGERIVNVLNTSISNANYGVQNLGSGSTTVSNSVMGQGNVTREGSR